MTLKIRFANKSDLSKCKKYDPVLTTSRFAKMVGEKEVVVAYLGRDLVGYLRIEFIWLKIPYVSWITVDPTFLGAEFALEMVKFTTAYLKKKKFKFLLSSYQSNAPDAKRWHTKLGFKKCGKVDGLNDDKSSEIFCRLKL